MDSVLIVGAHYRPSLVPVSILLALPGCAPGNYLAPRIGHPARMAVGH